MTLSSMATKNSTRSSRRKTTDKIAVRTSMLIFFMKNSKKTKNKNTVRSSRGELRSPQTKTEYATGYPTSRTQIKLILKYLQNYNHENAEEYKGK